MIDKNIISNILNDFQIICEKVKQSKIDNQERRSIMKMQAIYMNKLQRLNVENESAVYALINYENIKKSYNVNESDFLGYIHNSSIPVEEIDPLNSMWKAEYHLYNYIRNRGR